MVKLSNQQYSQLLDALMEAFPGVFQLKKMLKLGLGRELVREASGDGLEEVVFTLIGKAEANRWLLELVNAARDANPTEKLKSIVEELKPMVILQNIDHFQVCFVGSERAMVNRKELRKALVQLEASTPGGRRILIVNGPPTSGKTYSLELIAYLREAVDTFKFVLIDLGLFSGKYIGPEDVAYAIVYQMNLDPSIVPQPDKEQHSRWVLNFCDRLTGKLNNASAPWWLVIDGFNHVSLSTEVNDLILELGRRIRLTLPGLRMVLLSYPETLSSEVEAATVLREIINPIGPDDLITFFIQRYKECNKSPTTADITQKVREVMETIDPHDPRSIVTIGAEVARVAKSIT